MPHPPEAATAAAAPAGPARTPLADALVGLLAAGAAVVPCVFTTRVSDTFVVPKLAGLWLLLIAALVLVAAGSVAGSPTGRTLRWVPAVDVAAIAFLVLNLLAAAFSTDRHQSLFGERLQHQGLLTTFLYLASFLLARHAISDGRSLTILFGAITAGAVVVAGYAILQKAGLDPVWDGFLPEGRVFSTFGQPNTLAAYLVMAVPPACYLAWKARGPRRVLLVGAGLEIVVALLLTLSRGGAVALAVVAVVPLCVVGSRRRRAGTMAALVAAAALAGLLVPPVRQAISDAWAAFTSRGGGQGRRSIRNHLDTWDVAARITRDHPLLGTGQETFPDVFPRYSHALLPPDRVAYFDGFRVESAHNVYLTMSASTGVPSVLAYLALIVGVGLLVARAVAASPSPGLRIGLLAAGASVAGHLASDLFMTAEVTSSWLLWTLLGASVGIASSTTFAKPSKRLANPP